MPSAGEWGGVVSVVAINNVEWVGMRWNGIRRGGTGWS